MADQDINVLNTLIATTIDSANGFEEAAKRAKATSLSTQFAECARDRWAVASTLQGEVGRLGGTARKEGTTKAAMHRRWLDLKNSVSGGDRAVLQEVENGETYIRTKYEAALQDGSLSEAARRVVTEAFDSVRQGHDRVSTLNRTYSVGLPQERQVDWRAVGLGVGLAALAGGVVLAANRSMRRRRATTDTYRPWTPARPAEAGSGASVAGTGRAETSRSLDAGSPQSATPALGTSSARAQTGSAGASAMPSSGKRDRSSSSGLAASGLDSETGQGAGSGMSGTNLGSGGSGVGSFGAARGDDLSKK